MRRITGAWLCRPETGTLFDALSAAGHKAYFVGGCVRDALAERDVSDIDIATDAPPETAARLLETAGFRVVPTGIEHGTITVVSGEIAHEVTTFRRDVETDGRRAVVAFSDDMAEDARRRDFTINALYADRDGRVLDPLGSGVDNLRAGCVRFVGSARDRIREDYLRILRYFRFHAGYGKGGPDTEALSAIAACLDGLDTLSSERVGHEMLRLLDAPDPARAVAVMARYGVLARILPGAEDRYLPVLVHLEAEAGIGSDPIRRLACLGGSEISGRLRLSRAQDRSLARLRNWLGSGASAAEIGFRDGYEVARDVILLRAAATGVAVPETAFDDAVRGSRAEFPLKASDLMPRLEGAALGRALKAAEARWIASGFALDRDALLED